MRVENKFIVGEGSRESRADLDSMVSQDHRFFRCSDGKTSSRCGRNLRAWVQAEGVLARRGSCLFGELATFAQREKGD